MGIQTGDSRDGLSLLHGFGDLSWEDLNGWVLELSNGVCITSLAPKLKAGLSWDVIRSAYLISLLMAWASSQYGGARTATHFLHRRLGLQDLVSQQTRQKLLAFPAPEVTLCHFYQTPLGEAVTSPTQIKGGGI